MQRHLIPKRNAPLIRKTPKGGIENGEIPKKKFSRIPLLWVALVLFFCIYVGLLFAHIRVVKIILKDTQRYVLDYTGLAMEYDDIKYTWWKIWDVTTVVKNLRFIAHRDAFHFQGNVPHVTLHSNAIFGKLRVFIQNDITFTVSDDTSNQVRSSITWDRHLPHMIELELSDTFMSYGNSSFVKGVHYVADGVRLAVNGVHYISSSHIDVNFICNVSNKSERADLLDVTVKDLLLAKENEVLRQCRNIFGRKVAGGLRFNISCSLSNNSKDGEIGNAQQNTEASSASTFSDPAHVSSSHRATYAKSLLRAFTSRHHEENDGDDNSSVNMFSSKQCGVTSNIGNLSFHGDITMKDDVLQYVDLYSSMTNYEELLDCYMLMMQNSIHAMRNNLKEGGQGIASEERQNVEQLFKAFGTEKIQQIKDVIIAKLHPTKGGALNLHLMLKDPEGSVEIENGGSIEELIMLLISPSSTFPANKRREN